MLLHSCAPLVPWAVRMRPPIRATVGRTVLWLGLVVGCLFLAAGLGGQVFGLVLSGPYLVPVGPRGNWYDLCLHHLQLPPPQLFDREQFHPSSTLASPGSVLGIPSLSTRPLPSPSTLMLVPAALLHPRMPPKLGKLCHHTKLSWHSTKRRWCTKDRQETKEYFRCQLESFPQEICDHYIVEFGGSHRVYAYGPHSRQFYSTLLQVGGPVLKYLPSAPFFNFWSNRCTKNSCFPSSGVGCEIANL
jgi:hypothetical protein